MTAASRPQLVTLRSGEVVQVRQVQPDDAPALVRAYTNLGEQSRYRRFFTVMPELPEATLKAAVEVDHTDHEALVAVPQTGSSPRWERHRCEAGRIRGGTLYQRKRPAPGTA